MCNFTKKTKYIVNSQGEVVSWKKPRFHTSDFTKKRIYSKPSLLLCGFPKMYAIILFFIALSKILEATTASKMMVPSPITVSMAKSAASAVTSIITSKRPSPTSNNNRASLLKPSSKKSSSKNILGSKASPESSRSSSRNSSVSPRERPQGAASAASAFSKNNRASPPSAKKHPKPKVEKVGKPLVPWSQRNLGPPKNSNGWSWVGDGIEQKVYLNVSFRFYT